MKTDFSPHDPEARLRAMDAAPAAIDRERQELMLNHILGSEGARSTLTQFPVRRRRARWLAIPAAAAAATAGVFAFQSTTAAPPAAAAWSATPAEVDQADVKAVEAKCSEGGWDGVQGGEVVMSERRGDYVAMLISPPKAADEQVTIFCVGALSAGSEPEVVNQIGLMDEERGAPGPGQFTGVKVQQTGPGGSPKVSSMSGRVGPDVTGLTIQTSGGKTVKATVKDGRYMAFWPGVDPLPTPEPGAPKDLVRPGEGLLVTDEEPDSGVELTLKSGEVVKGVIAPHPSGGEDPGPAPE